jgi:hypothetical protein
MDKINEIENLIKNYINNNYLILQNTKPNLSKLWYNFLNIYTNKIIQNLKRFETIVNSNEINEDLSLDTITFLYMLQKLDYIQ